MEAFDGAWSTVDHVPTLTETCEGGFPLSRTYADSVLDFQGDEWDPFLQNIERDASTTHSAFDLTDMTTTSEATCGAVSTSHLPLTTPWSSASSDPSMITPPNSATEPAVLTFNAPVTSHPQPQSTLWTYPPYVPGSHFGNLSHEGLGIHFPNSTRGHIAHSNMHPVQFFDGAFDRPVASIEHDHKTFVDHGSQHNSYAGDSIDNDEDSETDVSDPCYAKLLWTCLKEAPGHTLSLKELYEWVSKNSSKAKDPRTRGWQNSVRHNLSMNAAFERVPPSAHHGTKKGSLWRLTDKALREGVISTTRYRKDPKRKPERRGHPALKRQISGAKGGQATRAANRRQHCLPHVRSMPYLTHGAYHAQSPYPHREPMMSPYSPQFTGHSPHPLMTPLSPSSPYHLPTEEDNNLPAPPSYNNTPPQVALGFIDDTKSAVSNFAFQPYDLSGALFFPNREDIAPGTPSMATEASFLTDECVPELLSRDMSRETTMF